MPAAVGVPVHPLFVGNHENVTFPVGVPNVVPVTVAESCTVEPNATLVTDVT